MRRSVLPHLLEKDSMVNSLPFPLSLSLYSSPSMGFIGLQLETRKAPVLKLFANCMRNQPTILLPRENVVYLVMSAGNATILLPD